MNQMVGFIGLGIMGKPMAKNLLSKGVELMVNDLDKDAVAELVSLGAKSGSLSEIGEKCQVIFTILPNGAIVQSVLFEDGGVAESIKEGSIIVDMSSVTPVESHTCADKLEKKGVAFLDAPVSGGEPKAIDGSLAFMVGGPQKAFDSIMPYFEKMGASALLVGGTGSGSVTKLANQVIVNLNIAAVSEALVMATKAGADPELVYKAIRGGLAGSTVLDAKAPLMIDRKFAPGGKISINLKDIKNVMATAHAIDVPMPMSSQLLEIMQALKVDGHVDDDHGGIVQYFEKLAQVEVRRKEGNI
ncbi:MAG: 2-hydroxy-3-oxopropionate reductase [Eubacteriaceae bacterium]|jgi:2-hydroxy-3-oxopropionate reductase|nr:2-hydroxy-3-oxopropionate reductase [Eubacteriaceae bacterium]MDK2904697.1 2-hydroxy-3-oxopropionate reductase [Eubacteriaceae bacterium]MDK2936901.1 2-hydroxy-3-oxopropionate reductase [Eubacteriaceae bacterium]